MPTNAIELVVLNQISHVLVHQRNVSALIREVLDILYREMGLQRGTITLKRGDMLVIEASHGLTRLKEAEASTRSVKASQERSPKTASLTSFRIFQKSRNSWTKQSPVPLCMIRKSLSYACLS
jgi:transcriptional regulator with GAF, ATPase, and Fis domain